jgi:hypothetical protein
VKEGNKGFTQVCFNHDEKEDDEERTVTRAIMTSRLVQSIVTHILFGGK